MNASCTCQTDPTVACVHATTSVHRWVVISFQGDQFWTPSLASGNLWTMTVRSCHDTQYVAYAFSLPVLVSQTTRLHLALFCAVVFCSSLSPAKPEAHCPHLTLQVLLGRSASSSVASTVALVWQCCHRFVSACDRSNYIFLNFSISKTAAFRPFSSTVLR